jgi:hypothetical protein
LQPFKKFIPFLIDETLANSIKESTQKKGENKRQKKENPSLSQMNPKVDHKKTKDKSCFKSPTNCKKHIKKSMKNFKK